MEHKMCILIFSTKLSKTLFMLGTTEGDMKKNVYIGLHVMYPLCMSDFK
jgi:hypothetical protein